MTYGDLPCQECVSVSNGKASNRSIWDQLLLAHGHVLVSVLKRFPYGGVRVCVCLIWALAAVHVVSVVSA